MQPVKLSKAQIKEELWRRGDLTWKMHKVQKEMYEIFSNANEHSTLVWLLSRQTGKSFLIVLLAIMQCLKKQNSVVKILTDTKLHARNIFEPLFRDILTDCPEDIRPSYEVARYTYVFPNGSQIQLAGSDSGHAEKLRGQKSELVLVDEAGFCTNLEEIVVSILLPTTIHTGGKIVLASTPSADPHHEFHKFIEQAEAAGVLTKKTVWDNPLLDQEKKLQLINQMGGEKSPKVRRELFCELARDEDSVLFPEFNELSQKDIVREWPKPPYYDCYVGMDLGYHDLTAVVFGYYDFRAAKVIIEDEICIKGSDVKLPDLCDKILSTEAKLWTNDFDETPKKPLRYSDINYIVTQEMARYSKYQLNFLTPRKDDNQAAINNLRVMLANKQIIIHPRCETLIRHLKNVKWKDKITKSIFARSPDDSHYDSVDALKYLVRMVNYTKNPYPAHYNLKLSNDPFVLNPDKYNSSSINPIDVYRKIFGVKKKHK